MLFGQQRHGDFMTAVVFKRDASVPSTLAKGAISLVDTGSNTAAMYVGSNTNVPIRVIGDAGAGVYGYTVASYGAVGNGVTNDSTAIQNCINAAQAANVPVIFDPSKTYLISTGLTAKAGNDGTKQWDLTIIGNGAVIKAGASMLMLTINSQCTLADKATGKATCHINISDLEFNGNSVAPIGLMVGRSGYFLDGFLRNVISNVLVYNCTSGSAVWFYNARQFHVTNLVVRVSRVQVHADATNNFAGDLYFSGCDFEGVLISPSAGECRGIHFDHCNFYQTVAGATVQMQPTGTGVTGDVWFDGCQFDSYIDGDPPIVINASASGSKVYQVYIINNYFAGYHEQVVYATTATIGNAYMLQFTDNIVQFFAISPANDLVSFDKCYNVAVNNNQYHDITVVSADQLHNFTACENVVCSGNISKNTSGYYHGVTLSSCTNAMVIGNGLDVGNAGVVNNASSTNVTSANNSQW